MEIEVISSYGYEEAKRAVALSYGATLERMDEVIKKLDNLPSNSGEQKHNEFITIYCEITAPRYWWQQFDTYRVGITKYSESTMHTILKRKLTAVDFEGKVFMPTIIMLNNLISDKDFEGVKNNLPESFKQKRLIKTDKKTILYIINQRKYHRLKEWKIFCEYFEKYFKMMEILT